MIGSLRRFVPKVISTNRDQMVMEYVEGNIIVGKDFTNDNFKEVVKTLKELHKTIVPKAIEIDYPKVWKWWKKMGAEQLENEDFWFEKAMLQNTDKVFCHLELSTGNTIFTKEKLYVIDYEYSGLANEYWDVVSFLYERDFSQEQRKYFINQYFGNEFDEDKFLAVKKFMTSYWAKWCLFKYSETKKPLLKKIHQRMVNTYLDKNII